MIHHVFFISLLVDFLYFCIIGTFIGRSGALLMDKSIGFNGSNGFNSPNANLALVNLAHSS